MIYAVSAVPMDIVKCTHAEKGAKDLIDFKSISLDVPAHKGGDANFINIKGNMKEYQDLEKVTIKTYFHGVRMDSRDAAFENSFDEGDELTFRYGAEIPSIAPSATYLVQMEFKNVDNEVAGCASINLKF